MSGISLMVVDWSVATGVSDGIRFGGLPSVGDDFNWPTCTACQGHMQFLGQIRPEGAGHLHLIFMCENHPGECGQWEADGGANAVVCIGADNLHLATAPTAPNVTRDTCYGATAEPVALDYEAARGAYQGRRRDVLGYLGGTPNWLQSDQTPTCSRCQTPMRFVAALETGPDHRTEMNFGGGGCGYLFECDCAGVSAKFLWQC